MSVNSSNRVIYTFKKLSNGKPQDNAEIRARITTLEVKGKPREYADLRIFVIPRGENEFVPTGKGLTIERDSIPELKRAVDALYNTAKPEE